MRSIDENEVAVQKNSTPEDYADTTVDIKDRIRDYIQCHPTASFAELANNIAGFGCDDGVDLSLEGNIVLWVNMSSGACDAIKSLTSEKAIEMTPTEQMVYIIDGCCLNLPLVKSNRKYKHPHWLPVTFRACNAGGVQ